ncbi:hypothetical protein AVEN_248807-1 [Araneus ventricosus]|uniref:CCHC-type domain-containing protein n=1 Tax=Araneus ventricosus TaxID=182803 RepID=A0A4Y2WDR2_ARAVE|nr:hypothetical protein AVEN_248807-1 [Araneus ventricosus]
MIENPSTISEAVEFATLVENSQELLTPNVNVVEGYAQNNDFEKILKTTTETYAKSLELVTQQLQALTSRLDYLQSGTDQQRNFRPQVITCTYCSKPGHIAPNCYQKSKIVKQIKIQGKILTLEGKISTIMVNKINLSDKTNQMAGEIIMGAKQIKI